MFQILIVEDDKELSQLFQKVLEKNGYQVKSASDGAQALEVLDKEYIDLIISDIMMPVMDGYELVSELRSAGYQIPVLMITAKGSFDDMRQGFFSGSDDYMVKPFHEKELAARIFSALRRRISAGAHTYYEAGNLKVDFTKRQVLLGGTEVHFSPVEYRIIESLALNSGTVVTYQMLLEKIWGPYAEQNSRILRVNMTNIRKKIESSPLEPEYITTVPRVGYRMLESQAEKGGMQMLENQTGRNMKVMEGQNIRNGIRMMA